MSDFHLLLDKKESMQFHVSVEKRLRRMRIVVDHDCTVKVQVPEYISVATIRRFVAEQWQWIHITVAKMRRRKENERKFILLSGSHAEYQANRSRAEILVRAHINELVVPYAGRIARIDIGNQKTRWGSCSHSGTLRFNYRIVHLPPRAQRYLVAHEVAHLLHMNHSREFWQEVERLAPAHKEERVLLRRFRIISR